jgi:hypothetical protein
VFQTEHWVFWMSHRTSPMKCFQTVKGLSCEYEFGANVLRFKWMMKSKNLANDNAHSNKIAFLVEHSVSECRGDPILCGLHNNPIQHSRQCILTLGSISQILIDWDKNQNAPLICQPMHIRPTLSITEVHTPHMDTSIVNQAAHSFVFHASLCWLLHGDWSFLGK